MTEKTEVEQVLEQFVRAAYDLVTKVSPPETYQGAPPRLVVCLNDTPTDVPEGAHDRVTGDIHHTVDKEDPATLDQILAWIEGRLHKNLDDAWNGRAGKNDEWSVSEGEEAWARALSEITFGMRYGGPGQAYFGTDKWDSYIFSRIQRQSVDFAEACTARKDATFPATHLEIAFYKEKLKKAGKTIETAMKANEDPAVSLACACQHLSTYGVLTRGFTLEQHLDGCNLAASQNKGRPIFDDKKFPGGKWYPTNVAHLRVPVATGLEPVPAARGSKEPPATIEVPIRPGAVYCYNPFGDAKVFTAYVPWHWIEVGKDGKPTVSPARAEQARNDYPEQHSKYRAQQVLTIDPSKGVSQAQPVAQSGRDAEMSSTNLTVPVELAVTGQRKGSHINVVLRVSKDKKKVQLLDTSNGHPLDQHKEHTLMDPLGKEGIYDGNFVSEVYQGHTYCGLGLPPEPPEDLLAMAKHVRRARPIGMARLVVTERVPPAKMTDDHILYVSKMFRMYGDGADDNFHTARCVWALRNMPGTTNLQGWLVLYVPRGELARMMWEHGARGRRLAEMEPIVYEAKKKKYEKRKANPKRDNAEPLVEPKRGLSYLDDYRDTIVLTNGPFGKCLYWNRKRSELSFGSTDEKPQGNPLPDAIRARVAPMQRQDPTLRVPYDGEHVHDRFCDPYTGDYSFKIPDLFRELPAQAPAPEMSPAQTPESLTELGALAMVDDSDQSTSEVSFV